MGLWESVEPTLVSILSPKNKRLVYLQQKDRSTRAESQQWLPYQAFPEKFQECPRDPCTPFIMTMRNPSPGGREGSGPLVHLMPPLVRGLLI